MTKRGPYFRKVPQQAKKEANNKVRQWREYFGWSQEDLATESELSVASISAYERGDNDPSLSALDKLAAAFGIPRGMLLDVDPREVLGRIFTFKLPPPRKS